MDKTIEVIAKTQELIRQGHFKGNFCSTYAHQEINKIISGNESGSCIRSDYVGPYDNGADQNER
jgi:hypothetical protein